MKASASPPAHRILGHLPSFVRDPLGFLTHCARNYGPVVPLRMAHVPAVLLTEPTDIERVLVTEHRSFRKPAWLRTAAVRRLLGDGLVTNDGEEWRRQRHACQHSFQLSRMGRYGEVILAAAHRMLGGWEPGQTRRLQRDMSELTLAIVARTLLDVDVEGWTSETSDAMDTLMGRFAAGIGLFGMAPIPPAIREIRAARRLNRIVDHLIERNGRQAACRGGIADSPDLVTHLRESPELRCAALSKREIRDQVKTFLGAGYESSALTLTWAFLSLAAHPAVESALHREIDSALPNGLPAPDVVARLPYAEAIIKETLRLYPPLWMTGRQSVSRCEFGAFEVPAGALIMTSQWAVQRHPRLFDRADEFRPERWLNGECSSLPRYAYFPFGGGPRVCIGQSFAMMETVLLLATIARTFRLEPVDGRVIRPWATMTLRPPPGVCVRIVERRHGEKA